MRRDIEGESGNRKKNGKKQLTAIIVSLAVIAVAIVLVYYFSRTQWDTFLGSEGHFSKDTYLDGGTGEAYYNENMRIYYQYTVISGGVFLELSDSSGKVVYRREFTESCEGYIYMSEFAPGTYYDHEGALNEDSEAYSVRSVQEKHTNWENLWHRIKTRWL